MIEDCLKMFLPTNYALLCEVASSSLWAESVAQLFTGLPQTQSESVFNFVVFLFFVFFFFLFFSVSVKVLPVTPLLSGVFVHRAFYAYFLRIERVVGNA